MPAPFEFAGWTPTLLDTLKALRKEGILSGDVRRVKEDSPAVQLSNLELTDSSVLREFGFGLFLAWFYDHKFGDKYRDAGSYHLVAIDDDTTLFLCHHSHTRSVNFFAGKTYVGCEEILPTDIRTANGACQQCPIRSALKYNYAALRLDTTPTACDPDQFAADAEADCGACEKQLAEWLKAQIRADDGAAVLLGGDGCLVEATPRLYEFFLRPGATSAEQLLNSFLVPDLGLRHSFFGGMSGSAIRTPVLTGEIDGFLYGKDGATIVSFETGRGHEIVSEHLRKKMAAAAALSKAAPEASFGYVTLSIGDTVRGGDRGNLALAELLARQVRFEIIGAPPGLTLPKASTDRFSKAPLRALFEHYLTRLDQLVPQTD